MENSNKRHGKKSDKETQSPVLKVFKEMIQRENNDPEKANLLKEKQEKKKRRQYSASRSKLDRNNRSCDSSGSEKNRCSVQYKVAIHEKPSLPFEGEKRDSWWFWSDVQKKPSDETCSCVSCALKRIISSEYTCIACLCIMFLLSVLVAFMILFRAVPVTATAQHTKPLVKKPREGGSEMLKRKIDQIQRGGGSDDERSLWDETRTRHLSSLLGLHGNDFDDNYRELSVEDSGRSDSELSGILDAEKMNDGLSSERLRNFYKKLIKTDAQIQNLKKGVNEYTQTNYDEMKHNYPDRAKRSLRLGAAKPHSKNHVKRDLDNIPNLPITDQEFSNLSKFNIFYPPYVLAFNNSVHKKSKRHANITEEPTGFLIEKKQIVVQYKPHDAKKVAKCSHAPKDTKSHEKQLTHPFYKNTQRLDELLDQFLDKNLPEMMADPFGVEVLLKNSPKAVKNHKTNVKIEAEKDITTPVSNIEDSFTPSPATPAVPAASAIPAVPAIPAIPAVSHAEKAEKDKYKQYQLNRAGSNRHGLLDRDFFDLVSYNMKKKFPPVTETNFDVILSVSTIVNPYQRKVTRPMKIEKFTMSDMIDRVPHLRKLLQADDENEEGLGYEDFKEVLADDTEVHDETDKRQDRKKRDEDRIDELKMPRNPYNRNNPPGVHNPNWKGPMPLYQDEISSMIKQAAIQNMLTYKKGDISADTKELMRSDSLEKDLTDMDYIETYSENKFHKLAKMNQAYSDYGVLEGKKDSSRNDKELNGKNEVTERRVKLSVSQPRSLRKSLFERFKKRKVSEGIRIEMRPTTSAREDTDTDLLRLLTKHVKVTSEKYSPAYHSSTPTSFNKEYKLFSTILQNQENIETTEIIGTAAATTKKSAEIFMTTDENTDDAAVIFTFAKNGRRSLKSVDEVLESHDDVTNTNADSAMLVKGMSGFGVIDAGDGETIDKSKTVHDHHHKHHHSEHHHSHNKSDVNEVYDNPEVFEGRSLIVVNETDKKIVENNKITRNATDSKTGRAISVPDNNLISNILNLKTPKNGSEMALSDFFGLMSDWFSVMAGFDTSSETNASESNIIKLMANSKSTTPKINESQNIEFPMYDSDMIDNIAHRSRVLMSVNDNIDMSTNLLDVTEKSSSVLNDIDVEVTNASSVTNSKQILTKLYAAITTNVSNNTEAATKENLLSVDEKSSENKTLVKRHVPDNSNLIFWNDIYDDEYGVKLDPMDNSMSDKHDTRGANFVRKSGNWIQDKVKNFASNFRGKDKIDGKEKIDRRSFGKRKMRKANYREDPRKKYNRFTKRAAKIEEAETEDKTGFAELTAKMKEVCKEAAKAVLETKNVQVRQSEKEDTMTTSLMKQLVSLMTDLVDFQVQQKTCVKLSPDLEQFLVWLTSPNAEQVEFRDQKSSYHESNGFEKPAEQIMDLVTTPTSEKEEVHTDSRSECLGTLHAVQDLMQQYDEMSDEEKSKMTGIRDYLENQLQFLHRQLASFSDNKMSNMLEDQNPLYRYRRELPSAIQKRRQRINQLKLGRNLKNRFKRRFLKNYGKKHTRSTASIYDGFANTDVNKFTKDSDQDTSRNLELKENKNVKRNLKDVYYKALNDAKKASTFKTTLKDDMEGFDHAQIVKIDN